MTNKNLQSHFFSGVYTAIVTPFTANGTVDYAAYELLVQKQVDAKVAGIVVNGTTGESPTLHESEVRELVIVSKRICAGKCQVVLGTGSNSTESSIKKSKLAQHLGVDGVLLVNPYYNKPTQEGLYLHFKAIADSISIPVMLYNIKGRTGVNLETKTLVRLVADCKNILSVKEASGDLAQMKEVLASVPQHFSVLSGDDGITFALIKEGGVGVVSVASNIIPEKIVEMVSLACNHQYEKASVIDAELQPLFATLFIETNPIPIKAALAMQGQLSETYRLPMCPISATNKEKLREVLLQYQLL